MGPSRSRTAGSATTQTSGSRQTLPPTSGAHGLTLDQGQVQPALVEARLQVHGKVADDLQGDPRLGAREAGQDLGM
jgi:hypothetical protein